MKDFRKESKEHGGLRKYFWHKLSWPIIWNLLFTMYEVSYFGIQETIEGQIHVSVFRMWADAHTKSSILSIHRMSQGVPFNNNYSPKLSSILCHILPSGSGGLVEGGEVNKDSCPFLFCFLLWRSGHHLWRPAGHFKIRV